MITLRSSRARIFTGSMVLLCAAISLAVLYRAGCTGDAKTGALGDPVRALDLEEVGTMFEWLGVAFAVATVVIRSGPGLGPRFKAGAVALLIGLTLGTFAGLQFESLGVRTCFAKHG